MVTYITMLGYPGSSVVKNQPSNAGDKRDMGLIPGSGKFPGGGNGNLFQYLCLENSMDRGAWQATVHRFAELAMTEHACLQSRWLIQHLQHSNVCDFLQFIVVVQSLGHVQLL